MQIRRTKIIATLGPATDEPDELRHLIQAGVDSVRINFSHGNSEEHQRRITMTRQVAAELQREIAVIADLQGPKIRIARFKTGKITLTDGSVFILNADLDKDAGDSHQVGIDYPQLVKDVHPGDTLLLDDGRIVFKVEAIKQRQIICRVEVGGELSNHKGINRQGGGLSAQALTDKDRIDLKTALQLGADYIAISFPRNAQDVIEARKLVQAVGGNAGIIAKIERTEAVAAVDEIIQVADAVMVARGDLGVEIGDAELPAVQKHIIHQARALNKAVITATQMMESMTHSSIPTRAEVFDVANAVLDGTDAVMLSAETATGNHPAKVVEAMARICLGAEKQPRAQISRHRVECRFQYVNEAIAMATMYTANHLDISAILALTEFGSTPLWMSRIRSGIPIYGLTRNISTQRKMNMYRGVYPVSFDATSVPIEQVESQAINKLKQEGKIKTGELVIITCGDLMGVQGRTNTMKIIEVN